MSYIPTTAKQAMALVEADGLWKIHFMQFVDDFRRLPSKKEKRRLVKDPASRSNERYFALISSIVNHLCYEVDMTPPAWAFEIHWLPEPWFVSGFKSLYAIAIAESPLFFRRNNIFVMRNFLDRC
jgi:hypothetical protein